MSTTVNSEMYVRRGSTHDDKDYIDIRICHWNTMQKYVITQYTLLIV